VINNDFKIIRLTHPHYKERSCWSSSRVLS